MLYYLKLAVAVHNPESATHPAARFVAATGGCGLSKYTPRAALLDRKDSGDEWLLATYSAFD